MDGRLWINLRGPDAVYLAAATTFITMLGEYEKYKLAPEHLGYEQLCHQLAQYRGYFEGGKHGDRINIALRKGARQTLTSTCRQGLHFVQAVATEVDMPKLLQGGVMFSPRPRKKTGSKTQSSSE